MWGPEPSRAQLLQGRAAPTQTVDSKLPLALGFAYKALASLQKRSPCPGLENSLVRMQQAEPRSAKSALAVDAPCPF